VRAETRTVARAGLVPAADSLLEPGLSYDVRAKAAAFLGDQTGEPVFANGTSERAGREFITETKAPEA
jgi:hypothetical protein